MNFFKRLSLEKKLVASTMVFLMTVFAVSIFTFQRFSAGITHKLVNSIESRNRMLIHDVSTTFHKRYSTIRSISTNPVLLSHSSSTIENALNEYSKAFAMYDLIVVTDLNGELIASNTLRGNGKAINVTELKNWHPERSDWFDAFKNNKFYEDQENGFGQFYYGRPSYERIDSKVFGEALPLSPFTLLINGQSGRPERILTVFANYSWMEEDVKRTIALMGSAGHGEGTLALFDKNGDWFFSSKDHILPPGKKYEEAEIKLPSDFLTKSTSGALLRKPDGTSHYVAANRFEDAKFPKGLEMFVVQTVPEVSILGEYRNDIKFFYINMSVIITLLSTVAFFLYRSMAKSFATKVAVLGKVSKQSSVMSNELSSSSQQLSAASSEQASAIQETVSALSEMTSMIAQTSNSSQLSLQSANSVSEKSDMGRKIMSRMTQTMKQIEERSAEFLVIHQTIRDIQTKTGVINDIVFKTQLLSFNASIEAARAGQEGRGFAVVAEEVGNLAKMSGTAAKEIENLLIESERRVSSSIDTIRQSVNEGGIVGKEATQSFNEIANYIKGIREQVSNVAEATRQQQLGIQEANRAMKQLDLTARQNYECAMSVETHSKSLFESTRSLMAVEEDLVHTLHGSDAVVAHVPETIAQTVPAPEGTQFKASIASAPPEGVHADDDSFRPAA